MNDQKTRRTLDKLFGTDHDDPIQAACQAAESSRHAGGYVDVPGYGTDSGDGIPVSVDLYYYSEDGEGLWKIRITVPYQNGERTHEKEYRDHFTATAVFEWLLASYGLVEDYEWDEEEDEDEEQNDEENEVEKTLDYNWKKFLGL